MESLIKEIKNVKKESIEKRLAEFKKLGKKPIKEIFKELCFCTLTANYSAEGGIRIQKQIGDGFLYLCEDDLKTKLKENKYRFPNIRTKYIIKNRNKIEELETILKTKKGNELREWIVENIIGIGYKEASHFLRNIGFFDYAIIDFHIIDLLVKYKLIKRPKTLTKIEYLKIENTLRKIAKKVNMSLGKLDLYLWYLETGKILK